MDAAVSGQEVRGRHPELAGRAPEQRRARAGVREPPRQVVVRSGRARAARATRLPISPGALLALRRTNTDVDARSALATIQPPTLIVHRSADLDDETDTSATEIAHYMAAQIAGRALEVGRFDWRSSSSSRGSGERSSVGEVLVSGTVKDLVAGSGIAFDARGVSELKGLGEWPLYAVAGLG